MYYHNKALADDKFIYNKSVPETPQIRKTCFTSYHNKAYDYVVYISYNNKSKLYVYVLTQIMKFNMHFSLYKNKTVSKIIHFL